MLKKIRGRKKYIKNPDTRLHKSGMLFCALLLSASIVLMAYPSGAEWEEVDTWPDIYTKIPGNVGIGTNNPSENLEIESSGNSKIKLKTSGSTSACELTLVNSNHGYYSYLSLANNGNLYIGSYDGSNWARIIQMERGCSDNLFYLDNKDCVGIGTNNPTNNHADSKLTVKGGNIEVQDASGSEVVRIGYGLDYSEGFSVTDKEKISPGTVLIIDQDNPGKLTISKTSYDTKVAGIVSGANNLPSGVKLGGGNFDFDVALAGRVYCNVDATECEIKPGDLLTTSSLPGHAMKVNNYNLAQGAILGKAMEGLEKGKTDQILVLVTLQ